jgi:Protein of unknown function (DUF3179)
VVLLLAAACAPSGGTTRAEAQPVPVPQTEPSPREQTTSALDKPDAEGLPAPLVNPRDIVSGGPPPDGIPALDHPKFVRASDVTSLKAREPVLAVQIGDDARAYPIEIMTWHEIANDTVADVPVAVSYCPLCNSAIAYDRRLDQRILDFGTSGKLYQSALVMYDRQTESLWSHFTAQAVAGVLTGAQLRTIPVATVSWGDWRRAHPHGLVLSRDTGYDRPYGQNPYLGYDDVNTPPFLFSGEVDGRFAAKERVVGVRSGGDAIAILNRDLKRHPVIETSVGGRSVIVWRKPGTASALDDSDLPNGRDVGATGAFEPVIDGQHLTFERTKGGFRDHETGSGWDVLGRAITGPLAGRTLTPVEHVDTFWFAWATFLPNTRVIRP